MINKEIFKIASRYKSKLEEGLNKKVSFAYGNDCITFDIYDNAYDYKRVAIKYTKGMDVDIDIVEYVKFYLTDKECFMQHTANSFEILVIELLKEYKCKDMYVYEGLLYCDGEEIISFEDVESFTYNKVEKKLVVVEKYEIITVDFVKEGFTYVEI